MESLDPRMLMNLFIIGMVTAPLVFINILIAGRKGKSKWLFGLLSVIPFLSFFCSIYLVSLTDKDVKDKIDQILAKLESN